MTAAQQLDAYRAGFADARTRLHRLADPLSDAAFNWKPGPTSWSVGECIVHLNTIGHGYVPALEAGVRQAPPGDGPFRYGWVSRRFIEAVRPGSRALPTASAMKPPASRGAASDIDRARAFEGLDSVTEAFLAILAEAEGRDLTASRVRSPFLALLRLPVGAFLEALSLHALRHTGQAERVADAPGFPVA